MRPPTTPTFGELLRRFRGAANLTQEELAERSTLSPRGISDLERGVKTRPQRATVRLLADALGLTEDERVRLAAASRPPLPEPIPARPLVTAPCNLPAPPTPLIGRAGSVAGAVACLREPGVHLLTVTGPGGVGKSRLALAVAELLRPDFPDGVFFVPLAAIEDPCTRPCWPRSARSTSFSSSTTSSTSSRRPPSSRICWPPARGSPSSPPAVRRSARAGSRNGRSRH